MTDLVFFYGTLMTGFQRPGRARLDRVLAPVGRAWIHAALFDLGIYPAAVPAPEGDVWGEVYEMADEAAVLAALDDIEGYRPDDPDKTLYSRSTAHVTMPDGTAVEAWVYFYNAPLGRAPRIASGDYLEHTRVR
jgi:gamma-glutamylcyclotransferase (GGCT)/AIG2-like uncharacterized protein YtfP